MRETSQQYIRRAHALARTGFLFAALAAALALLVSCSGDDSGLIVKRGRSLEIHATQPEVVDKVAFLDFDGGHRVIRPVASNRRLAVVKVTIVNRTSTVIPLLIDPSAAELGDRRTRRVEAADLFELGEVLDAADPEENTYVPFLWGDVELARNTQVSGWMVFDVPRGLTLGTIWWNEVDDIVADFISYR